ncbi:glycosyl transferase [Roseobacter sp. AzwK-3b]|nr:glycosyl transferase [Roseobacter sp. AzwK-3b]
MRVVVVSNFAWSLTTFRGDLIKQMVAGGHDVHVVAPDFENDPELGDKLRNWSVTPHTIAMSRAGLTPIQDLKLLFGLYCLFREVRADHVFGYTSKPVIFGTLAGRLAGVSKRFVMINGLGYAFTGKPKGKRRFVRWLLIVLYWIALKNADGVFFQNPDDSEDLRRLRVLGPRTRTILVNGSGVNTSDYPQQPIPSGPISFLLIARLIADKGIREYLAAARAIGRKFPDVRFHLVGDYDPNPSAITPDEIKKWSQLGNICFHGHLNNVRDVLKNCSVYVLPSYYREGTPRSILEALSTGRPVITTDAPGCRETVQDGINGFLIPARDAAALAAAMENFIDNPALVVSMGQKSREMALNKYDVKKVNAVMLDAMDL